MKLVSKLALGVAFVALAATGAARAETLDKVVKIGNLNDMSGLYADLGGPGSALAVAHAHYRAGRLCLLPFDIYQGSPLAMITALADDSVDTIMAMLTQNGAVLDALTIIDHTIDRTPVATDGMLSLGDRDNDGGDGDPIAFDRRFSPEHIVHRFAAARPTHDCETFEDKWRGSSARLPLLIVSWFFLTALLRLPLLFLRHFRSFYRNYGQLRCINC